MAVLRLVEAVLSLIVVSAKPEDGKPGWDEDRLGEETRTKKQVRLAFTHLGLMLSLVLYGLVGGAIFQALEQPKEKESQSSILKARTQLLDEIRALNQTDPGYRDSLHAVISWYESELSEASSNGISIVNVSESVYNTSSKWDYWSSVFFAGTVFTTIGYGHLAPKTDGGRVAMIIYGTIGIPLCLIVLSDLGGLISKGLRHLMCLFIHLCKCKRKKLSHSDSDEDDEEITPDTLGAGCVLLVLLVCILVYMFVVAAVYISWETQWRYFDSFYFLFVSVSTVGFGDIVPDHPNYFIISIFLIFLGLALFSTVFTVVGDLLRQSIKRATREIDEKLGIRQTDKKSECDSENGLKTIKNTPSCDKIELNNKTSDGHFKTKVGKHGSPEKTNS